MFHLEQSMKRTSFCLIFLICTGLYFHGYHWSHFTSGKSYFNHPLDCLLYFMGFFGNPFQRGLLLPELQVSHVFGSIIFIMFCFTVYAGWKMKMLNPMKYWLVLAGAMICLDGMLVCGRMYTPLIAVRYEPLAGIFVISLAAMINQLLKVKL